MQDSIGIVIIGRNEGQRLMRCLASMSHSHELIYVDSGSSDGSVELARKMGAEIIELDMSFPFSAARARNEGVIRLMQIAPSTQWIQFVDGDCEMVPTWLERAVERLASNSELAAVCGRLRERFPDASIYNRSCDMEWDTPTGITDACGGIAMFRLEYFQAVGGFNGSVSAGEEPELCQRLRRRGWKIERLADEMARHDAAMTRFSQWWRRQFRGGYNGIDVARRFDLEVFGKLARSAQVWTLGPFGLAIVFGALGQWFWGWRGIIIAILLVIVILLLQAFRIGKRKGGMVYGIMTVLSKWAQLWGQIVYYLDRRRGRTGRLIEYKSTTGTFVSPLGLSKEAK